MAEPIRFEIGGLSLGQIAERLVRAGFAVFPLAPGSKIPLVPKRQGGQGVKDATRDIAEVRRIWERNPQANIGVSLAGWIVVDVDPRNGGLRGLASLQAAHGELATLGSWTGTWVDPEGSGEEYRGLHLWYRLPEGVATLVQGGSLAEGVDFKTGPGSYVLGPGSWHASGVQYVWADPADSGASEPAEAPDWLIQQVAKGRPGKRAEEAENPERTGAGAGGRSRGLAGLINLGLEGAVGSRNMWVTGVMGHLAKLVPYDDGVRALGELVWRLAEAQPGEGKEPYTREEYEKTVSSIIGTERGSWPTGRPSEGNGFLVSSGTGTLMALCGTKDDDGDEAGTELRTCSNFDIRALGLSVDDEGHQTWYVEVLVGTDTAVGLLDGSVLGSERDTAKWLSRYGAVWTGATGDKWKGVGWHKRVLLYLASQGAVAHKTVEALGWSREGGGFVTHDGVITARGAGAHRGATPAPILRNWAPFRYGFSGSVESARSVLREIMTFHDPIAACVYGAWWAACMVKPQMFKEARVFPIMALEAPSETGKTNGLFALLMELSGNTQGQGEMTMADLRDRMSAHHSGIMWIDDITDMEPLMELLRQSAVEGSRSKKGADRHTSEHRRMIAPVALSAEGLGAVRAEKAMMDRTVLLKIGSPVSRRSLRNATVAQYDDIIELRSRYEADGGLTSIAGWMVQLALGAWEEISLKELRTSEGRHAWKIAVLRAGARILAGMMGPAAEPWEMDGSEVVETVDRWCADLASAGTHDRMVLDIIPKHLAWASEQYGMPRSPSGAPPVYVDRDGAVWVYPLGLAEWWRREHRYDKRAAQVGSEGAIRDQLERLGVGEGVRKTTYKPRRDDGRAMEQRRYYRLTDDAGAACLEAIGWDEATTGQADLGV